MEGNPEVPQENEAPVANNKGTTTEVVVSEPPAIFAKKDQEIIDKLIRRADQAEEAYSGNKLRACIWGAIAVGGAIYLGTHVAVEHTAPTFWEIMPETAAVGIAAFNTTASRRSKPVAIQASNAALKVNEIVTNRLQQQLAPMPQESYPLEATQVPSIVALEAVVHQVLRNEYGLMPEHQTGPNISGDQV